MKNFDEVESSCEERIEVLERQALSAVISPSGGRKRAHEAATLLENELLARGLTYGEFVSTLREFRERFHIGYRASDEAIMILKTRGLIEVRRGVRGGLYVSQPTVKQIAERFQLYLSLNGTRFGRVSEARTLARQMVVDALQRRRRSLQWPSPQHCASPEAFFLWLAQQTGNSAMQFIIELIEETYSCCVAEMTSARVCTPVVLGARPESLYRELVEAINVADSAKAYALNVELAGVSEPFDSRAIIAFPSESCSVAALDRYNQVSGGLAALLLQEINDQHRGALGRLASEEQIGERFGVNTEIVRQALRMLEDIGLVECQQGRRGAVLRSNPQGGAVIRIICAGLIVHGVEATEMGELTSFLSVSVSMLAATRVRDGEVSSHTVLPSGSLERPNLAIVEQFQFENFLLELAGNPVLSALMRALGLRYLFSDRCAHRGHFSAHIRAAINDCNWRVLGAIAAGDVQAAKLGMQQKNELMQASVQPE